MHRCMDAHIQRFSSSACPQTPTTHVPTCLPIYPSKDVVSSDGVLAPEKFSRPAARALQGILKARELAVPAGGRGRGGARGGGRGGGGRGDGGRGGAAARGSGARGRGRGGRGGKGGAKPLQLIACSATVSYRLRQELQRLLGLAKPTDMQLLSAAPPENVGKAGLRGQAGVAVPKTITHSWVACNEGAKAATAAAVLRALGSRGALLFLPDDAPLKQVVAGLRTAGVEAEAAHEVMGLKGAGLAAGGAPQLSIVAAMQAEARTAVAVAGTEAAAAAGEAAGGGEATEAGGEAAAPRLLVSTFGSSRGIDFGWVDTVVLLALPQDADTYLHLAGRTGRQGRQGRVVSLLAPHERNALGLITRALGISIRPDPELALALAQPTDAGAPAREGAAAAAGMAEAAAVRLPPATTGSDTPWDLPEAGDW